MSKLIILNLKKKGGGGMKGEGKRKEKKGRKKEYQMVLSNLKILKNFKKIRKNI